MKNNDSRDVYLVAQGKRLDVSFVDSGTPVVRPTRRVLPGRRDSDGELISSDRRAHTNALFAQVGPTISLSLAGVKVSAHTVTVLGGPWHLERVPGDDPRQPTAHNELIRIGPCELIYSRAADGYFLDGESVGNEMPKALQRAMEKSTGNGQQL